MRRFLLAPVCLLLSLGGALAQSERHLHNAPGSTCVDQELRLGFKGFKHCEYHALYQVSFKDWNCQCYSGQCRPTEFRGAAVTRENPVGLEVYINGSWFPIPENALRKERANMSPELLKWMAHVCANDPVYAQANDGKWILKTPPHIECAWINTGS